MSTKVLSAMNAVQQALVKTGIGKDQQNLQQGYKFRGIDDVFNEVGPLLAEHQLLILPRMTSWQCQEHNNAKGNKVFHVKIDAEWDFISVEDGSLYTVKNFGEAMDSSDKATNKAMSAAYKYAVIQAFAIPVQGEDHDADSQSPEAVGTKPREVTETLPKDKFIAKKFPAFAIPVEKKTTPPATGGELWQAVTISNVKPVQKEGWKKPMFWVELEDERSAFTWEEPVANDAKIMVGQMVNLKVKRSMRDASKFEYLGFEAIETVQDELGYLKE